MMMSMTEINLNELTLDNIGQWPKPVKAAAIAILFFLVIGAGYWLIVKGNFERYESLRARETKLRQEFEKKQHQASNLTAYQNQIKMMEEGFGEMLKQLPTENEMPGLLEDISNTGLASGLTFELFAPMPEVRHDFYIELPIKIIVAGRYHQLATFLSRVSHMDRIVTIHDFVIERESTRRQTDETKEWLVMKMTAKIYRYRQ